jgi:hypothetical protein
MNLLLFQTQGGDPYPILEIVSRSEPGFTAGSGRWVKIKKAVYRAYQRLMDKIPYHERLCSHLRHATDLQIYHPSTINSVEAQGRLRAFLNARHGKHSRWFQIDAVLSLVGGIIGLPLIPLPGPNFLFFIPAARTLGHYLARKGAQHALNCDKLSFHSEPLIDQVQIHLQDLKKVQDILSELAERYHLQDLEKLLIPLEKK